MNKKSAAKKASETPVIALIKDDPWLAPYEEDVLQRRKRCRDRQEEIKKKYGSVKAFAGAYNYFGINFNKKSKTWTYREWAPAATQLSLVGDFNNWNRDSHPLSKTEGGVWEISLPAKTLKHGELVKVHVQAANGNHDRMPAYIKRAVQDTETYDFSGQIWEPKNPFTHGPIKNLR